MSRLSPRTGVSGRDDRKVTVLLKTIALDIRANVSPRKHSGARAWVVAFGQLLLSPAMQCVVLYRFSTFFWRWKATRPIAFFLRMVSTVWGGTEIHPDARIGPGLVVLHPQKVIITRGVTIGANCRLSPGVGIGGDLGRADTDGEPVIGDGVMVGHDAYVMGKVTIGHHALIGAKSMVTKDVPAFGVVAGVPARLLRIADPTEYGLPADYVTEELERPPRRL